MPRCVLRRRSFFREKLIFTDLISESDRQFLDIWRQSLAGFWKVHTTRPDILWPRTTVLIEPILSNVFVTWCGVFWEILEKFLAVLSKFQTTCPQTLRENTYFSREVFIFAFGLWTKKGTFRINLHDCNNLILQAHKTFPEKKMF